MSDHDQKFQRDINRISRTIAEIKAYERNAALEAALRPKTHIQVLNEALLKLQTARPTSFLDQLLNLFGC